MGSLEQYPEVGSKTVDIREQVDEQYPEVCSKTIDIRAQVDYGKFRIVS